MVSDFAALAIGAADVPIYPTLTGEQIAEQMRDAGRRIAVVSSRAQLDKLLAVRDQTPLEHIVVMDAPATDGAIAFAELLDNADALGAKRDPVFDALARSIEPGDVATIIYTSGTTGEPRASSSLTATLPRIRTLLPSISPSTHPTSASRFCRFRT